MVFHITPESQPPESPAGVGTVFPWPTAAEDELGERLGFAAVWHSAHFTGESQAYIGELATAEIAEGRGVGRALVQACEQWAREP